jgi:hypothetical protein
MSRLIQKTIKSPYFFGRRAVQTAIFSSKPVPKNAGGRLVSRIFEEFQQPAINTKKVQHFGRFFHQIEVC